MDWMDGWKSPGGRRYRAPYGANNVFNIQSNNKNVFACRFRVDSEVYIIKQIKEMHNKCLTMSFIVNEFKKSDFYTIHSNYLILSKYP